jgi:exonuclease VII small subunit
MSSQDKLSINQKLEQLRAEVEWFSGDSFDLSKALENYKAARDLAGEIEKDLETLKNNVLYINK